MWEKHGKEVGELTWYADDFVVVCKTGKDAIHAHKLIQAIMERLELTLHPEKTRIVGLWTGDEGFDFLGIPHRKTKEKQDKAECTTRPSNGSARKRRSTFGKCAAKHAAYLVRGTRKVAQPENPRVEELLCDFTQHKQDGQVKLVHPYAADQMVRKKRQ